MPCIDKPAQSDADGRQVMLCVLGRRAKNTALLSNIFLLQEWRARLSPHNDKHIVQYEPRTEKRFLSSAQVSAGVVASCHRFFLCEYTCCFAI